MIRSPFSGLMVLLVGSSLAAGCGPAGPPPSAKAKGTVTHAGQPVAEAEIYFVSAGKGFSANGPVKDGKYEITSGLPPASYKVFLTRPRITKPPMSGEAPPEVKEFVVPEKYQSETTSDLKADIKAGENSADFKVD